MNKEIVLSQRLMSAVRMLTPGNRVVDVGCDHGFVSIYLLQQGISPFCLAMDVRSGPLSGAKEHVAEQGLEQYIETRLSDGLKAYEIGEADAMICCGMGGPLMARIMEESQDKARQLKELVLQPQSEIPQFREFLRKNGYRITHEDMVYEDGKYYFMMRVVPDESVCNEEIAEDQDLRDAFGYHNLEKRHPVLLQYLDYRLHGLEEIEGQLAQNDSDRARQRRQELEQERKLIQSALEYRSK